MTTDQPAIKARVAKVRLRLAFPVVWRYMNRRYDFTEKAVEQSRRVLAAAVDRIESERDGRDYLVGESFTVADMTASALLYPLVWPPGVPVRPPRAAVAGSFWSRSEIIRPSTGSVRCGDGTEGPRPQSDHQPSEPGSPLKGPSISSVIQPP